MIERFVDFWEKLKDLDIETLKVYRTMLFIAIVIILFGGYWYLGWKQISIALLLVVIIFLVLIMFLERQADPYGDYDDEGYDEEPRGGGFGGMDVGINSEDYNRNLEKALAQPSY